MTVCYKALKTEDVRRQTKVFPSQIHIDNLPWCTGYHVKRRTLNDTPKAFFLILNNFEFFSVEKVHIKFLQILQRFDYY